MRRPGPSNLSAAQALHRAALVCGANRFALDLAALNAVADVQKHGPSHPAYDALVYLGHDPSHVLRGWPKLVDRNVGDITPDELTSAFDATNATGLLRGPCAVTWTGTAPGNCGGAWVDLVATLTDTSFGRMSGPLKNSPALRGDVTDADQFGEHTFVTVMHHVIAFLNAGLVQADHLAAPTTTSACDRATADDYATFDIARAQVLTYATGAAVPPSTFQVNWTALSVLAGVLEYADTLQNPADLLGAVGLHDSATCGWPLRFLDDAFSARDAAVMFDLARELGIVQGPDILALVTLPGTTGHLGDLRVRTSPNVTPHPVRNLSPERWAEQHAMDPSETANLTIALVGALADHLNTLLDTSAADAA